MKRTYIAPMAETIKLNLSSSVLEDGAGVGNGTVGADASQGMQAKQFDTWNFDDEEEEEKQSNIWE